MRHAAVAALFVVLVAFAGACTSACARRQDDGARDGAGAGDAAIGASIAAALADASAPSPPQGHDASDAGSDGPHDAGDDARESSASAEPPCPPGMAYVSGRYCPKVERTCLKSEANGANHITLCHAFEHETRCLDPEHEEER